MDGARKTEFGVGRFQFLERGHAGKDATVDFRQHDVDREIRRRQPAIGLLPHRAVGAGQRHLQHRRIDTIEHRAVVAARGKGGDVDDHVGRDPADPMPQPRVAVGIFQARGEQADRPDAAARKFGHQPVDRIGVGGGEEGAIEHHQRDRRAIGRDIEGVGSTTPMPGA